MQARFARLSSINEVGDLGVAAALRKFASLSRIIIVQFLPFPPGPALKQARLDRKEADGRPGGRVRTCGGLTGNEGERSVGSACLWRITVRIRPSDPSVSLSLVFC